MNISKNIQHKLSVSWLAATIIMLASFSFSFGQDTIEKKKPILAINYFNINSDSFFVKVSSNYKDKKLFPIEYQVVRLYFNETDEKNLLGTVTTDLNGDGMVYLDKKFKGRIGSLSTFDLVAETDKDSHYKKGSGSVTIANTLLELQTKEKDSTRTMRAFVFENGERSKKPVKGAEVTFFVKRMIGVFPLSEKNAVTDSAGMAEIEYTVKDLPGDSLGTLTVGAKLSDADTYGTIMSLKQALWGKKTNTRVEPVRALWATADRVPVWLLFLAGSIIFLVWGSICYIVFLVYTINKLGKQES